MTFDDFSADVTAESTLGRSSRCTVGAMLSTFAPADADKVRAVMADPKFATTAIRRALIGRTDMVPSLFALGRHRRGDCACKT